MITDIDLIKGILTSVYLALTSKELGEQLLKEGDGEERSERTVLMVLLYRSYT